MNRVAKLTLVGISWVTFCCMIGLSMHLVNTPLWLVIVIAVSLMLFWMMKVYPWINSKILILALLCSLPSCTDVQMASGAHIKTAPWGKVAYSKGDEMYTSDLDAGWVATATGATNIVNGAVAGIASNEVAKSIDAAHQAANVAITRSNNAVTVDQSVTNLAKPIITNPSSQAVTLPTLGKIIKP